MPLKLSDYLGTAWELIVAAIRGGRPPKINRLRIKR